jgi:glycosyltransferase involved in cell wall biosynthesis
MNILQVCNKIPYPLKDGGAIAIHHMAKGLIEAGAHVDMLAMITNKSRVDEGSARNYLNNLGIEILEIVGTNTDISFTDLLKNLVFSDLPYNAVRFITGRFRKKLQEMLVKDKYDIVQFEGLYLMPYADTVRKYSDARIVLRAHNIEHEIWKRNAENQKRFAKSNYLRILSRRLKKYEGRYVNAYDFLVPITERDALKFNEIGNKKASFVCPFGYDFDKTTFSEPRDEPKDIFFIGSLDWMPNQEGLVWVIKNVWQKILTMHPDIRFYVAGKNAPQWLIRFFSEHHIDYMGEVDDAYRFMESKAIMVVPLFSGSGMRVKIVEAMAAGKVVISTSVGAEGIDLKNGEHLVIADNEKEFVSGIEKLLSNPEDFLCIAKNAINFVKTRYDNRIIVTGLFEFYKSNLP